MSENLILDGDKPISDDLQAIRESLAPIVTRTDNEYDDTILIAIDFVLASPGLLALLNRMLGGEQVEAISFGDAAKWIPVILQLLEAFRGLRK